jgi:hypothetical protein
MVMTQETQTTDPTQEKTVPESISLGDLQVLLQIVDLASSRGAFRGAELTQVGTIFDKLNTFLSFIAEQQRAKADEAAYSENNSTNELFDVVEE